MNTINIIKCTRNTETHVKLVLIHLAGKYFSRMLANRVTKNNGLALDCVGEATVRADRDDSVASLSITLYISCLGSGRT